jgi:hypothetical protein
MIFFIFGMTASLESICRSWDSQNPPNGWRYLRWGGRRHAVQFEKAEAWSLLEKRADSQPFTARFVGHHLRKSPLVETKIETTKIVPLKNPPKITAVT